MCSGEVLVYLYEGGIQITEIRLYLYLRRCVLEDLVTYTARAVDAWIAVVIVEVIHGSERDIADIAARCRYLLWLLILLCMFRKLVLCRQGLVLKPVFRIERHGAPRQALSNSQSQ